MPMYVYRHPQTQQDYEVLRSFADADKPFYAPDGKKCNRVLFPASRSLAIVDSNAEVFEVDPEYCKKVQPKYVRFRDGHRERYDPTKHC